MTVYVAMLRAVNVGGTGKLPMADLSAMCEAAGFTEVRTYIASGNVIFDADASEDAVKGKLESALREYAGKAVGVIVRTAEEMAAVLAANPFPEKAPNHTVAIFLDAAPPSNALDAVRGKISERLELGVREIYVDYGPGMGRSKLVIPTGANGTARNMNTIAKLATMASE